MNKYTLTFRCENLEQKYQDFRYLYTLPICKCLNAICFCCSYFKVLLLLFRIKWLNFYISLPTNCRHIGSIFHIQQQKKVGRLLFVIAKSFLMLQQQFVEDEFEKQEAFVFGQNQMLLNIMIILVSEFKFGSIQIFGNMTIKIVLSKYYQPSMPYVNIIYSIVVGLMFLYSSFKVHQQYRLSFLFKVKDSQQEQLIPLLTDSPFVLCTYDKDNLQFKQKFSNLQNHQEFKQFQTTHDALNFILRNYVIFGQSLEKFLLTRQKKSEDLIVNKILEVKSINHTIQEQKLCIRYSECYITELIFILIIDKKRQEIQNLNQKLVYYEQGLNKFLSHFRNF